MSMATSVPGMPPMAALVALVGAESTGKTTLAWQLAEHFGGLWVPEYLREFCDAHGRTPARNEQAHILQSQAAREDAARQRAQAQGLHWVFCDAPPLMTAVYSELVFGDTSLYAAARHRHRRYALTLLLENDLPWQADGLQRDGPQVREPVLALLERQLRGAIIADTLVRIGGQGAHRLRNAVQAVASMAE
ncbi:AAA family ATPase [Corticibacter populi]|nr:ATP-binding protein [Corticibacter populi]RZS32971.1 nicotinamide riboside kinase [Corticibacter populi]